MASFKVMSLFVALAAASAADDLPPALGADDECAAGSAGDGCALSALQLRVQGTVSSGLEEAEAAVSGAPDMLAKVNGALKAKLGEINGQLQGKLKAKDPMTINKHKDKVDIKQLYGLSSLKITSIAAKGFKPPGSASLNFGCSFGSLKLVGSASGPRGPVPFTVQLGQVTVNAPITATLDAGSGAIQNFAVSGAHVNIGSMHVNVQIRMRFIANMVNQKVNAALQKKKGEIAGKISAKVNEALGKVLNGKVKAKVNQKMQQIGK